MDDINGDNDTLIVKQWGYQTICLMMKKQQSFLK